MLIGADIFFQLFNGQQIYLGPDLPTLLNTEFGYIVSGRCKVSGSSKTALISTSAAPDHDSHLECLVNQFWEMEKIPDAPRKRSKEHTDCEVHFTQHVKRLQSGRFEVKLPFKLNASMLGDSKSMAIRRFFSLERRLNINPSLKQAYSDFLKNYEDEGHMEKTEWPNSTELHYFMPHHCVIRPDKSTTKCRVVFDASAKTTTNMSLNDILMVGPVVQNELYDILLRFRLHKFGLIGDIAAMYRQIFVHPDDQKMQLIVWRNNEQDELQVCKSKTVTYGTSPAPFLATRCLVQLATDNIVSHPAESKIINNDFYVDDLITGGSSLEEIQNIKKIVSTLLMQGQFQLRKWHSNHTAFLNNIPNDDREVLITINNSNVVKALGIIWDSDNDYFKFNYCADLHFEPSLTKRKV